MGQLGGAELMIVLVIVVMLFGSTKLPQLARSLGQAKNEFKRGERDAVDSDEAA
jgi:sec-independent protein translocase protein TatA